MREPDVSGYLSTTLRNAAGRTWESEVERLQAESDALRRQNKFLRAEVERLQRHHDDHHGCEVR